MKPWCLYIHRLPPDVVAHIWGYVRQFQPPRLREDIESFIRTKREMMRLYRNYWSVYWGEEQSDYAFQIANDIICYIHLTIPRHNYIMNRISLFRRTGERYRSFKEFRNYHRRIRKNGIETIINVYWAILRPEERMLVYAPLKRKTEETTALNRRYAIGQVED